MECASHVVERIMRGQRAHAHRNAHAALGFHGYSSAPSRGAGGGRRLGEYYRQRIFSRLHTVVDQGRRERRLKTNDIGSSHVSCPLSGREWVAERCGDLASGGVGGPLRARATRVLQNSQFAAEARAQHGAKRSCQQPKLAAAPRPRGSGR